LTEIGRDVEVHYTPGRVADGERPRVKIATRAGAWPELELGLLGAHQATNAAVVVATVERLRELGLHLPARAVAAGLAHVVWPARMEILRRAPWVVLDCAHNVASAEALANALRESFPAGRRLLVFASSSDKDIAGILRHLSGEVDGAYLTRFANSPRAVAPQRLAELWREVSAKPSKQFDDAASAWRAALSDARSGDLIIVTGSVFLAGELRPLMMNLS
jgi:dihydrofolate synthase/folylpolyglutamate synthase